MAKPIADFKKTPPTSISQLTKDGMLYYIKEYGTREDKIWYANLCESNLITKSSNLSKKEIITPDISVVRKEFANRFFVDLVKKKEVKSKSQSYMEKVRALLEE